MTMAVISLSVLSRHRPAIVGGAILTLVLGCALAANLIITHDPSSGAAATRLKPPSAEHIFGTDYLGRDIFSRLIVGSQASLTVGFCVMILTASIGGILGLLAGYYVRFGAIFMRVIDGVMAIPSLLLAIVLMALTGPSLINVLIAISVAEIPRMVRVVLSVTAANRSALYVDAALLGGRSDLYIIFRHLAPSAYSTVVVQATYVFASAVLVESVLTFIGAGLPPNIPSWGNMIAEGRMYFQVFPQLVLIPGCALLLVIISINMLGDHLRDILDPKTKK
jgi:peptide/nickel transport system permease protein